MPYSLGRAVPVSHQQAVERVTQELTKEGFGVLTDIDVAAIAKIAGEERALAAV